MKAIKIDVEKQEVYSLDIEPGLTGLYQAIGCDIVEIATYIDGTHCMYVDEEGLLISEDKLKGGFVFRNFHQPLIGNAIIVNNDNHGNDTECLLTVEHVSEMVQFFNRDNAIEIRNTILGRPHQD